MKTILCFGDSNTRGYDAINDCRFPLDVRYPGVLQNILGSEYHVIEEGLDGRTTMMNRQIDTFRNANYYIHPCICAHKPIDYMIIMLGTNDCLNIFDLTAEDIARGMDSLMKQIHDYTMLHQGYIPKIILAVPASIDPDYSKSSSASQLNKDSVRKSQELSKYYNIIADKYNCIFFDSNDYIKTLLPDAVHISAESHKILAKEFASIIKNN